MFRLVWKWALAMVTLAFLLLGCGENESSRDDLPPAAPRLVERTPDDQWSQRGIRAEPVEDSRQYQVRIEWYANEEPDVAGYRVWRYGEYEAPYMRRVVADLRIGVDGEVSTGGAWFAYVDQSDGLQPDPEDGESRGYYWEIQAYDSAGNASGFSAPAYYRLINNPYGLEVNRVAAHVYGFLFRFAPNPDATDLLYFIRVYPVRYGLDSASWQLPDGARPLYGTEELVTLDFTARPLVRNESYVCQVNVYTTRPRPPHTGALAGAAARTTFIYRD